MKHVNYLFCLQGKNHSKKLRNFYAGSQQPPPIRILEVVEPVSQQPSATPPTDSANVTSNQVLMHFCLNKCVFSGCLGIRLDNIFTFFFYNLLYLQ